MIPTTIDQHAKLAAENLSAVGNLGNCGAQTDRVLNIMSDLMAGVIECTAENSGERITFSRDEFYAHMECEVLNHEAVECDNPKEHRLTAHELGVGGLA